MDFIFIDYSVTFMILSFLLVVGVFSTLLFCYGYYLHMKNKPESQTWIILGSLVLGLGLSLAMGLARAIAHGAH